MYIVYALRVEYKNFDRNGWLNVDILQWHIYQYFLGTKYSLSFSLDIIKGVNKHVG